MSDDLDTEVETQSDSEGIKSLRKQFEAQKKELAELREFREKASREQRQSSVAEVLKAKGIPAGAAKFYDGDDTSEDAVGKWLEAHADVFQIKSPEGDDGQQVDENAQAAKRVTTQSFGTTTNHAPLGRAMDPEEALRLIQTQPYEELEKLGLVPPREKLHGVRKG